MPGPENKPFMTRMVGGAFYKTLQTAITAIKPDDWMSALQPLQPWLPMIFGRQWDFQVGRNINYQPRGGEKITFWNLRQFARNSEIVRLAIETRKDQLCSQQWQIKGKEGSNVKETDPRLKKWQKFFSVPDGQNKWSDWYRVMLEELFVTDAVTIWRQPNKINGLARLRLIDGATIFPLITDQGYRPDPPDPAFQQILKGVPKGNYTRDELIYAVRNVRVYTPYGYPPVEQCIKSLQQDIVRTESQTAYFTVGSVPDAYMTMPDGMPMDKIEGYGLYLNDLLQGNIGGKRQMPVAPFGTKIDKLKEQILKDDFDEWVARKICFALSIPPTPFIRQMNRSTAESGKEQALEEGQGPVMNWTMELINSIMAFEGDDDLEFSFLDDKELDQSVQSTILVEQVGAGIISRNEARDILGLDPSDEDSADQLLVTTASGLVPLPMSDLDNQMQEQKLSQQVEINQSKPAPALPAPGAANQQNQSPKLKAKPKQVGKAVGDHKPLSFQYAVCQHHARQIPEGD